MKVLLIATSLLVMSAACGDGSDEYPITTFKRDDLQFTVSPGEEFQIELGGNPSVGDGWRILATPAPSVAQWMSASGYDTVDEYGNPPPEEGKWEFNFEAVATGATTVELFNCYRCPADMFATPAPEYETLSERLTFSITVD